jgi:hypothetical protein
MKLMNDASMPFCARARRLIEDRSDVEVGPRLREAERSHEGWCAAKSDLVRLVLTAAAHAPEHKSAEARRVQAQR